MIGFNSFAKNEFLTYFIIIMKKAIKKLKSLFFVLVTVVLTLHTVSCEKEEFETLNETTQNQSDYQVKKISFSELKLNRTAFEKLKESRSKINPSLLQRGVYNEDFGVFIDTTNILITEKDGKHSITFRIINDAEMSKIENLVLNSKEDGSYKAFITEYLLSQEELTKLANNEVIEDKSPAAITDVSSYARFSITGNGADCVSMQNYTVGYCTNAYGETIIDTGINGGPLRTTCVGGWHEVEYVIMVIDEGCLTGGGGGGGNDSGGDNSGYNPGGGSWSGGGGGGGGSSSTGGNPGNSNTGNPNTGGGGNGNGNGNVTDPSLSIGDGTPIITTPILTIDKREVRLYNLLNPTQQTWWNNASQQTKNALLDYFNQNSPNNVVSAEAMAFILELIDIARTEPNQADVPNLVNLIIITKNHGLDNSLNNNYLNQIDPYVDLDLSSLSEENHELFLIKLQVKYIILKTLNPTWSEEKLYLETLREAIHLGLDILGLVPFFGEPADLVNGVLYSLNGDTLNASLSFASALPIVGYGSTATKFGLKARNYYNAATNIASNEVLVWKITSNIISFGDRAQLRKVLGLGSFASNGQHAHHLIPWEFRNWSIIQKAAKSGDAWHMNDFINGIPLNSTNHLTGHDIYNNKIGQILTTLSVGNPNPQLSYQKLTDFSSYLRSYP
jgi:hypothetical protein